MKRQTMWWMVSGLMVLSMVLASCATTAPEKEKVATEEKVVTEEKEVVTKEEVVTPGETRVEKPRYGGTVVVGGRNNIRSFDPILGQTYWPITQNLVYENLVTGDRTMGPAGSGKTDWVLTDFAPEGFFKHVGSIAESWEMPDDQTLIFKIRKGIRWHNKPPVNGREVDANDVVFTFRINYQDPQRPGNFLPIQSHGGGKVISATATDQWTAVIKVESVAIIWFEDIAAMMWIVPHELWGNKADMTNWRNSLGSGPFMLTDFLSGSTASFVRNPNWWVKEVVGPGKGDQLPYLDRVTLLIIPDISTLVSAMRTGKVDHLSLEGSTLEWQDVKSLEKTNPEIKAMQIPVNTRGVIIKATSKDPIAAPLMNKRVRQALSMAIDQPTIFRDLYESRGTQHAGAFFPGSPYYQTFDQMVEILQRVYGFKPEEAQIVKKMNEYHPEEAKRILAEEGYPNGFKTQVVLPASDVDWMSVVKEYWSKIGVDLEMVIKEPVAFNNIATAHTFPAMISTSIKALVPGRPEKFTTLTPGAPAVKWKGSDRAEYMDETIADFFSRWYPIYSDFEKRNQAMNELEPHLIQLGWWIEIPAPATYRVWQPWLKGYYGEGGYGYRDDGNWLSWAWLDQDLKKQMGYR